MIDLTPEQPRPADPSLEISEGVRRAKAAIRRDLPELMAKRRNRGKYVLYHRDARIGIGDYWHLIGEVNRLNIPDGEFFIARIRLGAGSEEEEDVSR